MTPMTSSARLRRPEAAPGHESREQVVVEEAHDDRDAGVLARVALGLVERLVRHRVAQDVVAPDARPLAVGREDDVLARRAGQRQDGFDVAPERRLEGRLEAVHAGHVAGRHGRPCGQVPRAVVAPERAEVPREEGVDGVHEHEAWAVVGQDRAVDPVTLLRLGMGRALGGDRAQRRFRLRGRPVGLAALVVVLLLVLVLVLDAPGHRPRHGALGVARNARGSERRGVPAALRGRLRANVLEAGRDARGAGGRHLGVVEWSGGVFVHFTRWCLSRSVP